MKYSDFTDGKCFFAKLALKWSPKRKSRLVEIFADIYIFLLKFQVSVFIEIIDILEIFREIVGAEVWRGSKFSCEIVLEF